MMGQDEIYKILKKSGKPMTTKEIMKISRRAASTTNHTLRALVKYNEVIVDKSKGVPYRYRIAYYKQ